VQLHQYAPAAIDTVVAGSRFALTMTTSYPDDGTIVIRVDANDGGERTVSLRVPAWAEGATVTGPDGVANPAEAGGTARVTAVFAPGDEIRLHLPVAPRWTVPDPRIDAVRGCAAVERGPVVLCAESIDLPGGADVADLTVDVSVPPFERDGRIHVSAQVHTRDDDRPYGTAAPEEAGKSAEVALIPFHRRANRGPASMRVWLPAA